MDKTDGFIPGMEDSEEAAKSFLDSFLDVQSPADEISDSDLQARDTANMIKHGELYTQLLDIYVSDIKYYSIFFDSIYRYSPYNYYISV